MSGVVLASIVEGHGETAALPILLRRLAERAGIFDASILPPFRLARSKMLRRDELVRAVRFTSSRVGRSGALFVICDSDDDCPVEIAKTMKDFALEAGAACRVHVVVAEKEYESIFLAALPSLEVAGIAERGSVRPHNPEAIRGAKEELRVKLVDRRYKETQEQARFTARIDLDQATTCRWLRKLEKDLREVLFGQSRSG